jgi:dethiobiotin synthetase
MAHRFIISGTGPRAGRTTVGCALAFAAKVRAFRVAVMKPAATRCADRDGLPAADDAAALIAAASADLALEIVSPFRYRSSRHSTPHKPTAPHRLTSRLSIARCAKSNLNPMSSSSRTLTDSPPASTPRTISPISPLRIASR